MTPRQLFFLAASVGMLLLSTTVFAADLPALVYALVTLIGVVYYD